MSQKILIKEGLRVGKKELELLQSLGIETMEQVAKAVTQSAPAVLTENGDPTTELQVTRSGNDVIIAPGSALLADGTILSVDSPITATLPGESQSVVLEAVSTPFGKGTISIGAGNRFVLTYVPEGGSSMTAGTYYAANDFVRLVNGGTSLGTFRILSVSSNTINLSQAVPGSSSLSGLKHAPAGKFFAGYPVVGQTTDLVSFMEPQAVFVAGDAYTAAPNQVKLAFATAGAVQDRREALRARGMVNIPHRLLADGIPENKLALSQRTRHAQDVSDKMVIRPDGALATTEPAFYVTVDGGFRRVLLDSDLVVEAIKSLTLTPSSAMLGRDQLVSFTATATVPVGVSVQFEFTSQNETVATVGSVTAGTPVTSGGEQAIPYSATVTAKQSGWAEIVVRVSATSQGNFIGASVEKSFMVNVNTGVTGGSTSLTMTPASTTLSMSKTSEVLTATVVSSLNPAPVYTIAWSKVSGGELVNLSSSSGTTTTVSRNLGTGSALIRATATAAGHPTIFGDVTVGVSSGVSLTQEAAMRVNFAHTNQATYANIRWGLGGGNLQVTTLNGVTTVVMTLVPEDNVPVAGNELQGLIFYDASNRKYLIVSNTAASNGQVSMVVERMPGVTVNPSGAWGVVRSLADKYRVEIRSPSGDNLFAESETGPFVRSVGMAVSSPQPGNYLFRLTGSTNSGESVVTERVLGWGEVPVPTITYPSQSWISVTDRSTGSVSFAWDSRDFTGFDPRSMQFWYQVLLNDDVSDEPVWNLVDEPGWKTIETAEGGAIYTQRVFAPSNTKVTFRVVLRSVGVSGVRLNPLPVEAWDDQAVAYTLPVQRSFGFTEYTYTIPDLEGLTWTNVNGGTGPAVWAIILPRSGGGITSFTVPVSVTRILLASGEESTDGTLMDTMGVVGGTLEVKAMVFPSLDFNTAVKSDLLVSSSGSPQSLVDTDFMSAERDPVPLHNESRERVVVALEWAGSGDPNGFKETFRGKGTVQVWFRLDENRDTRTDERG
jgi:hypothetical protein